MKRRSSIDNFSQEPPAKTKPAENAVTAIEHTARLEQSRLDAMYNTQNASQESIISDITNSQVPNSPPEVEDIDDIDRPVPNSQPEFEDTEKIDIVKSMIETSQIIAINTNTHGETRLATCSSSDSVHSDNSFSKLAKDLAVFSQTESQSASQPASQSSIESRLSKTSQASIITLYGNALTILLGTHGCYQEAYNYNGNIYSELTYPSKGETCYRFAPTGSSSFGMDVDNIVGTEYPHVASHILEAIRHKQELKPSKPTHPNIQGLVPNKMYGPNDAETIADIDTTGNFIGLLFQSVEKTIDELFDVTIFTDLEYRKYCMNLFAEAFYLEEYTRPYADARTILVLIEASENMLGNDRFNLFCFLWDIKDNLQIKPKILTKKLSQIRGTLVESEVIKQSKFFTSGPGVDAAAADGNDYILQPPSYPWTAIKHKFITNSLLLDYGMRLVISLQIYNSIDEHQVICFLRNPRKKLKLIDMACSNAYNAKGEDVSPGNASQINAKPMHYPVKGEDVSPGNAKPMPDDEDTYDEAANISGKGQIPTIKPIKI